MKYITDIRAKTSKLNIRYLSELREIARKNRYNPTQAEFIMWQYLRNNKFGYKFTRQKPINRFVLDFYCSKLLLCVEIDGGSHINRQSYDLERDKFLENCLGIKTIRFTNDDVLNNFSKIKETFLPFTSSVRSPIAAGRRRIKGRCHELVE